MTIKVDRAPMYLLDKVIHEADDEGDAVRWVAEGVLTHNGKEVMP